MTEYIQTLARLIDDAQRVVVFTGAGISTESGIPDFRSPTGIWSQTKPIYFDEYVSSADARREAWRRKFEIDKDMIGAEPNRGHRAVAKLVRTGKVSAVITQNIDGLHQESGVPDAHMIELHGNATYATCLTCSSRFELEPIKAAFQETGTLPQCQFCAGIVKTATISFGQAMPQGPMGRGAGGNACRRSVPCHRLISSGLPGGRFPRYGQEKRGKARDPEPGSDGP